MKYIIKNGSVVFPGGVKKCDVLVEDGKIAEVGENISCDCEVLDAEGLHVFPGSLICTSISASPVSRARRT